MTRIANILDYAKSIAANVTTSRQMADAIASQFGIEYRSSYFAESNGGSFYFKVNGSTIRVSDHRAVVKTREGFWDVQVRPVNPGYFEDRGLPVPSCNFSVKRIKGNTRDKYVHKPLDRSASANFGRMQMPKVVVR